MRKKHVCYALCMASAVILIACMGSAYIKPDTRMTFSSTHEARKMPPVQVLSPESLLNTGDVKALDQLPGVGPVIAERIVEVREKIGGFLFPEQLLEVQGIGEKRLMQIIDALNEADLQYLEEP